MKEAARWSKVLPIRSAESSRERWRSSPARRVGSELRSSTGFSQEGAAVVGEDIDPIAERDTTRFVAVYGDAADATVAQAGVAAACELFGGVDILVNIAGRFLGKVVTETSDEEWDAVMRTNVKSVFVHCRAAIPALIEGVPGSIVTVGSIAGIAGLRGQAAYSASKRRSRNSLVRSPSSMRSRDSVRTSSRPARSTHPSSPEPARRRCSKFRQEQRSSECGA